MLSPNKKQMINVNLDTLQSPTKSSSMKTYVSPKIVNSEPVAVRKVINFYYYHYHYHYNHHHHHHHHHYHYHYHFITFYRLLVQLDINM